MRAMGSSEKTTSVYMYFSATQRKGMFGISARTLVNRAKNASRQTLRLARRSGTSGIAYVAKKYHDRIRLGMKILMADAVASRATRIVHLE